MKIDSPQEVAATSDTQAIAAKKALTPSLSDMASLSPGPRSDDANITHLDLNTDNLYPSQSDAQLTMTGPGTAAKALPSSEAAATTTASGSKASPSSEATAATTASGSKASPSSEAAAATTASPVEAPIPSSRPLEAAPGLPDSAANPQDVTKAVDFTAKPLDRTAQVTRLNDLADQHISDSDERQKFKADMQTFTERAASRTPPLSDDQVAGTFKHVGDLLQADDNPQVPLTKDNRVVLAEQVMHQAAVPESMYQGSHNTCFATDAEIVTYSKNPAEASKLVSDMATTGHYSTFDGKASVSLPPDLLTPLDKEARSRVPADGDRSYASQVFQMTAINAYYGSHAVSYQDASDHAKTVPPGSIHYVQIPKGSPDADTNHSNETTSPYSIYGAKLTSSKDDPNLSNERLIDTSGKHSVVIQDDWKHNKPLDGADFDSPQIMQLGDMINGKGSTMVVEHSDNSDAIMPVQSFHNKEELQNILSDAKQNAKLPLILGVSAAQSPLSYDAENASSLDDAGHVSNLGHVVMITDYDATTGKVRVHNTAVAGPETDHTTAETAMSVTEVMEASRPFHIFNGDHYVADGATADLNNEVLENRKNGTIDSAKELDLERQRHDFTVGGEALPPGIAKLSDAGYREDIVQTLANANTRWAQEQQNVTFNQAEHDRTLREADLIITQMPADKGIRVLAGAARTGAIPPDQMGKELTKNILDFTEDKHNAATTRRFRANVDVVTRALYGNQ